MKIMCILTDGFEELEAVGTIALLRRAGMQIDVYALDHTSAIGRFQISIDKLLNSNTLDVNAYDALFIPGGPQHATLEANEQVRQIIKHFFDQNKVVSAICSGPTILGHLGYLKNKHYTCFTSMNEDFGGTYMNQYVAVDGNLITGRSVTATIDFALALLEKLAGKAKTDEIKEAIYY